MDTFLYTPDGHVTLYDSKDPRHEVTFLVGGIELTDGVLSVYNTDAVQYKVGPNDWLSEVQAEPLAFAPKPADPFLYVTLVRDDIDLRETVRAEFKVDRWVSERNEYLVEDGWMEE